MQTKHTAEQSSGQMNVENKNTYNKELVSRKKIPNTPFEIIGNEERGYFLAFGKYKLTPDIKTEEDVIMYLEETSWYIIVNIIAIMLNKYEKEVGNDKMTAEGTI